MPLTPKQVEEIKDEVLSSKRPLFFFHDDPDGLASFLLLYRMVNEGIGIPLKTSAEMGIEFSKKVESYQPDKVFILDKPGVSQDFIDAVKVPIIWIDHHTPQKRHKVKYYNPRVADANEYTANAYLCYQVSQDDEWIAMVGCAGDQYIPPNLEKIKEDYPDIIEKNIKKPEDILFNSDFGKLAKMFSFCLKGKMDDVRKCIKIMTRIKTPYELLKQETPAAKFIYKRFEEVNREYQKILKDALAQKSDDNILLFLYNQDQMSLNQDLANELLYKNKEKVIIIGRTKSGEVKLSFRTTKYNLPPIIQKALEGCEGYGGGHEKAAGANIKETDFEKFMLQFKAQLK
jgi:nanoRNase/pAp phosphatase (c-di-AMP/oligoRNAs hydrolase)